jgi:hypothetical protein
MLGIGRRDAKTRVAHLLCEMFTRLKAVGLEKNNTVPLSLTQNQVGDALGLSTVHVNRTLQALRGDSLLVWEGRALTVLDWGVWQRRGSSTKATCIWIARTAPHECLRSLVHAQNEPAPMPIRGKRRTSAP